MEERLDDAIHVLRNHAEAGHILPGHGVPGMPGMMPPHSNGLMPGSMGPGYPPMGMPPHMDSHMVSNSKMCIKYLHDLSTK